MAAKSSVPTRPPLSFGEPSGRPFPGVDESVPDSRRWAERRLGPEHPLLGEAKLIVSELATNACAHTASGEAGGRFLVAFRVCDSGVRIEVTDEGPRTGRPANEPGLRPPTPDDENGRGLAIVQAVAARWGSYQTGLLRTVWAEIEHTEINS